MTDRAPSLSIVGPADRGPLFSVAEARNLVETTRLTLRVIAARVGILLSTLSKLKARQGWRRPLPERMALEEQRGGGHPIVPEVVAEARALLEGAGPDGTRLTFKEIATRTGVSTATLCRWRKRHRWQRPASEDDAERVRPARYRRGRGLPYAADAVGAARRLVTTTLLSQKAIARQVGVSQAQISVWMRRDGWQRPPARPGGSSRFAASRREGPLREDGDRRGRPYATQTRREARVLWELTRLPTTLIGSRLGAHPVTIARWAKEEAWVRPRGRTGRRQLRGYFGMLKRGG